MRIGASSSVPVPARRTGPAETKEGKAMTTNPPRYVTFDVMSEDPDWYFVLTSALGDYAASARAEASDGGPTAAACIRWAETAEDALYRIEVALATVPEDA